MASFRGFASPRRRRIWRWLLAELAIVFLGVYGASQVDDWRRARADDEQRRLVVASLEQFLDDLRQHDRTAWRGIDRQLAVFEAARNRGERPVPPYYREYRGERPPTQIWDALIASGGARLLPPDLLFDVARIINNMDSIGERYVRYNAFTETRLMQLAGAPAGLFYEANGTLKGDYRVHLAALREIREIERSLVIDAAGLSRRLSTAVSR
ncbi:MAG: hypothetical protein ACT4OE_03985 [Sphingosinicella sp.]